MPHVGYSDSIMNDGPGFYSNISGKSSLNPSLMPSRQVLRQRVTLNLRTFFLINFAIEPPTPATARGRASLGGWQEYLFARNSLCPTPSHIKKLEARCVETNSE